MPFISKLKDLGRRIQDRPVDVDRGARFLAHTLRKSYVICVGVCQDDRLDVFDFKTDGSNAIGESLIMARKTGIDEGNPPGLLDYIPVERIGVEVMNTRSDEHGGVAS